jgi:phenylglyoxylate dehydrogenase epsilon subunit
MGIPHASEKRGSEPLLPSIKGLNDKRALHLRTLDDAKKLSMKMKGTRTAVILGGGLIGLHVAQCLAERKVKVIVVEMLPQILPDGKTVVYTAPGPTGQSSFFRGRVRLDGE